MARHRLPQRPALRPPLLGVGASYELVLLPRGLRGVPTIATWQDESGNGRHATAAGSPALANVDGLAGVTLDGVDDYLGGAIVLAADRPLSFFIVSKAVTQDAAQRVVLELSDTGATARGPAILQSNGYRSIRSSIQGNGSDAYYAYSGQTLALHEYESRQNDRLVREQGRIKHAQCLDGGAPRATTVYRIGAALGTPASFWQGSIHALVIVSGEPAEWERAQIRRWLSRLCRLDEASTFPSSGTFSDLHLTLPAVTDVIVGEPASIWLADLSTTVVTALPVDFTYADRIIVAPTSPGDTSLAITDGGVQATTTVHAVASLDGAAPLRKVLFVGDSNMSRMSSGAFEFLTAELGASKITCVGTQGPSAGGFTAKHEGRDSWGWNTFANVGPVAPGTSPFFTAGAINIAAYLALLTAPPDIIVWGLGANDIYGQTLASVDAVIDTMFASYMEPLVAAWRAACPDVVQIFTCPWPTSRDPAVHGNAQASMDVLHAVNRRAVQRYETQLAGRTSEKLYHRPTFARVDAWQGYVDGLHMNQSLSGASAAIRALKASLVARWPALVARITSAVVDGNVSASKLTLTFSSAATFPGLTGLSLVFTLGTTRTISSIDSGSGTTTVVLNLSGPVSGTDAFSIVVGATRTQTTVTGGEPIQTGSTAVSITNLSNPLLTAPGTPILIAGGDSLTFSSGVNIDSINDESSAGNHVAFLGGVRATQITTVGGHKHIRCAASPNHGWYQRNALTANIPANFSGTIYFAGKVANWNPSGGYGALFNTTNTTTEGAGYSTGMLVTPTSNSRWKLGYGADSTLLTTLIPPSDHHVWAWTIEHDVSVKLYKDGLLIDSGVPTPDPVQTTTIRLFTLIFNTHTPFDGDIAKLAIYAGSSTANAHDATQVALISTFLATLLT